MAHARSVDGIAAVPSQLVDDTLAAVSADSTTIVRPSAQPTGSSTATAPAPATGDAGPSVQTGRTVRGTVGPDAGLVARELLADTSTVDTSPVGRAVRTSPDATAVVQGPRPKVWARRYITRLVLADAVVASLAVAAALTFRTFDFFLWKEIVLLVGAGLAWPAAVAINHGYDRARIGVGGDEMQAIIRALILAVAVGAIPSAIVGKFGVVGVSGIAVPMAAVASLVIRYAARKMLHRRQARGENIRRVVIVGSAYAAADLGAMLTGEPHCGMKVIGVCVPSTDVSRAQELGLTVLGDLDSVPQTIETYAADAVAVTSGDATRHNYLRELSWALEGSTAELLVHPGLVEVAGPRMHIRPYVGLPLLHVEQPHFTGWRRAVKRAFDIAATSVGLLLISPILLAIALAVKLGDRGPIVFRQTRVGLDGSTFTMYKFRSMHVNAEERVAELRAKNPEMGTLFKMVDDPRITRVGKFLRKYSLDELPQLFNVLGGSMSLVGPRPPLQSEVDGYEDHTRRRLLVTPGLTGLWQVSGRSLLSWEESVRLDLRYVENWTLAMDLLIMWKTVHAVAAKQGAF